MKSKFKLTAEKAEQRSVSGSERHTSQHFFSSCHEQEKIILALCQHSQWHITWICIFYQYIYIYACITSCSHAWTAIQINTSGDLSEAVLLDELYFLTHKGNFPLTLSYLWWKTPWQRKTKRQTQRETDDMKWQTTVMSVTGQLVTHIHTHFLFLSLALRCVLVDQDKVPAVFEPLRTNPWASRGRILKPVWEKNF